VDDVAAMRRAIVLSARGLGTTSPNPPVGCVILDACGVPAGQGFHERKGEAHAEARALGEAGSAARGGTAFVTLEPCNHHGRTPPCHQALIDAGVRRVVVSLIDPTSRGSGGVARLREAGVQVDVGVLEQEAHLVLGDWLTATHRQRPVVTWRCSPDARGEPGFDRSAVAAEFDAVIDDPLTAREAEPGTHGDGALALPATLPPAPPQSAAALFQVGARTALIRHPDVGRTWLDAGLVDEVVVLIPDALAHARPAIPEGCAITAIDRTSCGLSITATPTRLISCRSE